MAFLKKHITFVLGFLPGVFFLIVVAALTFLATKGLDWGYVTATDIDTYAFLGVHQRILEGLASGNIKQAFTYAFYNYGYVYFLLNTLFIAPFSGFEWGWILMPRLLSLGWTMGTLWLIYRMTKRVSGPLVGIMMVSLVLSLPFFIKAAIWTHPEMMMLFFLVAMFERLLLSVDHKRFLQAALYFGLAVGVKFQAITMAPLLGVVGVLWLYRFPKIQTVKTMVFSFFTILAGYLIVNPHMLHPRGQYLFWTMLRENILSNANNHGTGISVTFLEKMYMVLQCYFSPISLGVFFCVTVWGVLSIRQCLFGRDVWIGLWVTLVINWGILLGSVSKLWPHYYLVVAVFSVIGGLQFLFGYRDCCEIDI